MRLFFFKAESHALFLSYFTDYLLEQTDEIGRQFQFLSYLIPVMIFVHCVFLVVCRARTLQSMVTSSHVTETRQSVIRQGEKGSSIE